MQSVCIHMYNIIIHVYSCMYMYNNTDLLHILLQCSFVMIIIIYYIQIVYAKCIIIYTVDVHVVAKSVMFTRFGPPNIFHLPTPLIIIQIVYAILYTCIYMYTCIHVHVYMYTYIHVYSMYMHICMYILYTFIYTSIHKICIPLCNNIIHVHVHVC